MSIFRDEEENDDEYYSSIEDPWDDFIKKKRAHPDRPEIKAMEKRLEDLRSNPSRTLDAERNMLNRDIQMAKDLGLETRGYFEKKNRDELLRSNPSYTVDAQREKVKKEQEREAQIKAYRTQTPNVVKTIRIDGDQMYGILFMGEADLLAYQVRNSMKFNKLDQSQGQRIFADGTRITVQSFFGQDIISIDVTQSTGEEEPTSKVAQKQCSVTLINLPSQVQPMKYPTGIETNEFEGTDYIKTYYTFDVGQCSDCEDIEMEFFFDYVIPKESRHHDGEPKNHCIYSVFPPCWGKVISHGRDSGGDYFIWKAFTEKTTTFQYPRTGLGVLDLKASINDGTGQVICDMDKKIDVDCCLKNASLRKVEIWWHNCPGDCKMVDTSASALYAYANSDGIFYATLGDNGGCVPFLWAISGPGSISPNNELGTEATFTPIAGGCNDTIILRLSDRCGTLYQVSATPCCVDAPALSINYTSLLMSCGSSQYLTATGGCGPYTWALTGGGSLSSSTGNFVGYTAPATNPNCTDNPTITVTDCCGSSAQVQLAVNCYHLTTAAIGYNALDIWKRCCNQGNCEQGDNCCVNIQISKWDCEGTFYYCATNDGHYEGQCCPAGWHDMGDTAICYTRQPNCTNTQCACGCGGGQACPCDTLQDCRTEAMKQAGCCPLNPFTGLPY